MSQYYCNFNRKEGIDARTKARTSLTLTDDLSTIFGLLRSKTRKLQAKFFEYSSKIKSRKHNITIK